MQSKTDFGLDFNLVLCLLESLSVSDGTGGIFLVELIPLYPNLALYFDDVLF